MTLTQIERRVLAYLDQRGPTHRTSVVCDLSSPDSKIGRGHVNGSNGGIPRIMGSWCRRISKAGFVVAKHDGEGYYRHHEITDAGRAALRQPRSET